MAEIILRKFKTMAGPIEILIVVGVFAIVGTYLYIVSRFIRAGEGEKDDASIRKPSSPVRRHSRSVDSGSPAVAH
jgi:hypothetical protein